jgi:hypothetical protein
LVLQPGARLNSEDGAEARLSAKTHAEADASMAKVAKMVETQALPFFETTKSVECLLEYLKGENWGSRHHLHLEIAFCKARLCRFDEAQADAIRAIELYREDASDWCPEYIELCRRLLSGIEENKLPELMRRWIDHSVSNLRLSKILQGGTSSAGRTNG